MKKSLYFVSAKLLFLPTQLPLTKDQEDFQYKVSCCLYFILIKVIISLQGLRFGLFSNFCWKKFQKDQSFVGPPFLETCCQSGSYENLPSC